MIKRLLKNIGPAALVTAAFIGPGTVTLCTIAGSKFSYALLWALVLSIIATIVLQEMAARLGLFTKNGLAEILRNTIKNPILKTTTLALILTAIVIGNTAYESGNLMGGVLGLEALLGPSQWYPLILGVLASAILLLGNYKILERTLMLMVALMGLSFLATAIVVRPDIMAIFKGMIIPSLPGDSLMTVLGLIGTTVVPYNLFLHAALVSEKWQDESQLNEVRKDTIIAIALGGLVSMAVLITAAATAQGDISNAADLAKSLEPIYGTSSKVILAIGLIAAGVTSAITAPLAAAFVASECFGWKDGMNNPKFKAVWFFIIAVSVIFAMQGYKPIEVITIAQIANGLLLPIIAVVLLWLVNQHFLKTHKNNWRQNILAFIVIGICILLAVKTFIKLLNG